MKTRLLIIIGSVIAFALSLSYYAIYDSATTVFLSCDSKYQQIGNRCVLLKPEQYCKGWCNVEDLSKLGCNKLTLDYIFMATNIIDGKPGEPYYLEWIGMPEGLSEEEFERCSDIIKEKRSSEGLENKTMAPIHDLSYQNNPYNNELILYQKDNFASLQYDKTKQVINETFLSKTVEEWQKVPRDTLMQEHEKYLPEHKFFDHLGAFLIKNEFQNMMNELDIVNVEDDFEVKGGMSLTSLPPHNSYYSTIKATDGNYYRFQGGTHANEVSIYKVSALLFFDTSVDFKMEDLVRENQLFTIMPESNNNSSIEPHNLIIHTNNSKIEFYNNTPEIIRIQASGTGTVGEEHLLNWVGPTILPYATSSMTFDKPGNYDFDARFAPNLENPLWWSSHTSGTIIMMSDDMSSVSREEKNKMAQSLLFDLGLPVIGSGTGNKDNVLSVSLDPSVVQIIPNATQYYKERIEQIFPFEIIVVMD